MAAGGATMIAAGFIAVFIHTFLDAEETKRRKQHHEGGPKQ
jgi:hypothetical protein